MAKQGHRERNRPPLDEAGLRAHALRYVGRYATTSGKLRDYLRRKLAERGWAGAGDVVTAIDDVVGDLIERRYVDDRAWAEARRDAGLRRGHGAVRVRGQLTQAGIGRELQAEVAYDEEQAWDAALALARRRRLGPFGPAAPDERTRQRALATMLRGGHSYEVARRVLALSTVPQQDD